jgi:hypothetical protein
MDASEKFRHECEVRYVIALPSNERRREYLAGVEKQRKKPAAERLRNDAWKIMKVTEC